MVEPLVNQVVFPATHSKHNAAGDGGLLLTDDDNIAERVRLYRNHGIARGTT